MACLQQVLMSAGVYSGELSGEFDQSTDEAVRVLQQQRGLIVDGIVGQQTATALGIWPQSGTPRRPIQPIHHYTL